MGSLRVTIDHGAVQVDDDEYDGEAGSPGEFHIDASLGEFTDFAAGTLRRRGAGLRVGGSRRRLHQLLRSSRPVPLADLAELELPIDPDLVLLALAAAIVPKWTVGYSFTVAFDLGDRRRETWRVIVDDGRPVRISSTPSRRPGCRVTLPEDAFLRFVCGAARPGDPVPAVVGDKHAAVMLMRWIAGAQEQTDRVGAARMQFAERSAAAA
jgi:hypothetical protein